MIVVDISIDAPTVIHLSKQFWYPKGAKVKLTPNDPSTEIEYQENSVTIKVTNKDLDGKTLSIHIRPKLVDFKFPF